MGEETNYPNFEPDTLGDLKEIKRIPPMQVRPPKIKWGDEYLSWPIEKRLEHAEKLAAAMNHAADVLQQERNTLLDVCRQQESQLDLIKKVQTRDGATLHHELEIHNQEKQNLYQEIVKLKSKLKTALGRIKNLGGAYGDLR